MCRLVLFDKVGLKAFYERCTIVDSRIMASSSTQNLCSSVHVRCGHFVQESRVCVVSDRTLSPFFREHRHASCLVLPPLRCATFVAGKHQRQCLDEEQSSKRNSLYNFLRLSRRNGVRLSSSVVGLSSQLFSLATDSSSCLPDAKGSEVTEEVPSSLLLCKDLDLNERLDDFERETISNSKAGKSELKLIRADAIGSKNMILQKCKERRFEWDTASEEYVQGQATLLKGDRSHLQESKVKARISSSLSNPVFASFLLHGVSAMSAFAAGDITPTESEAISESLEAASRAPTWLIPTVLAFPVVTYLLFNVYRDKVNPYAKISDWLFGLVVVVIVGNIVMMATLGVRLY